MNDLPHNFPSQMHLVGFYLWEFEYLPAALLPPPFPFQPPKKLLQNMGA